MMHYFTTNINKIPKPILFTYPFHYTPHPLCILASKEVQYYLSARPEWHAELQQGKMFGVLIVQNSKEEIGFLAAFSGTLAGSYQHDYFVPPIFDLLIPNGYFKQKEQEISDINQRIKHIQTLQENIIELDNLKELENKASISISKTREKYRAAKKQRDEKRNKNKISLEELEKMAKESQFQKAEIKRLEQYWENKLNQQKSRVNTILQSIKTMKEERKIRSYTLQKWIFRQFRLLNARGEIKDLCELFESTNKQLPPSGAGECAAPKLLQFAYQQQLKPIAMAEFWWGNSPKGEIRHHGYFYPACQHKCEPILKHMLLGLNVEPNPLLTHKVSSIDISIIYEDEFLLVINKPPGMLSVPGKNDIPSVFSIIKNKYPNATGPLIVHRLDMDTSGLLLIAKQKEIYVQLQKQFEKHSIKKKYIALLTGVIDKPNKKGFIRLPIRPDYNNRPLQIVDYESGKLAVTRFEIIGHSILVLNGKTQICTRMAYFPETGRTHQLRVHSAHREGMNSPIIGDSLYGQVSNRLYLHAEQLEFKHPVTGKNLRFKQEVPF